MGFLLLNIVQALFLATWTAFWISAAIVSTLVTFNRNVALAMARRLWAPGLIWGALADFRVEPLPDVDWSKPHIFVMNHESMFDIAAAFAVIPSNIRFVAKHSLKYVPFLGWYMWMTGMIFVNRSNRTQAVASLARAGERIRGGANIIAYPEGTRSKTGFVLPFKKGPFVVAAEAGVPIIPVAISGSGKVVPKSFAIRPGIVRMKLGEEISTKGKDRDVLLAEVHAAVSKLHREIGGAGAETQASAA